MALVEFRGVSYEIAGRPILRDLTFGVEAGETLVLLGRSGSGKTTATMSSPRRASCAPSNTLRDPDSEENPPPCSHTMTGRLRWSLIPGVHMFSARQSSLDSLS